MMDSEQIYGKNTESNSGNRYTNGNSYGRLPYIEIDNLSLYYCRKPAFQNINMEIRGECITALVGPSGCGKSSFLHSINRLTDLIPGCEVSGRIKIEGENILNGNTDVTELRKKTGLIFQKPNPFPLSIRKNIELPLQEHGVRDKELLYNIVENVLKNVGLWSEVKDRLNKSALSLSGGQQQRLCIARALALEPELLLLDEPCSALDPISGGVVEDLILSLRRKYTILIVTHNLAQARRIADYVALFWVQNGSGSIVEYGRTKQMFNSPQNELTKLYMNGLRG